MIGSPCSGQVPDKPIPVTFQPTPRLYALVNTRVFGQRALHCCSIRAPHHARAGCRSTCWAIEKDAALGAVLQRDLTKADLAADAFHVLLGDDEPAGRFQSAAAMQNALGVGQ